MNISCKGPVYVCQVFLDVKLIAVRTSKYNFAPKTCQGKPKEPVIGGYFSR